MRISIRCVCVCVYSSLGVVNNFGREQQQQASAAARRPRDERRASSDRLTVDDEDDFVAFERTQSHGELGIDLVAIDKELKSMQSFFAAFRSAGPKMIHRIGRRRWCRRRCLRMLHVEPVNSQWKAHLTNGGPSYSRRILCYRREREREINFCSV